MVSVLLPSRGLVGSRVIEAVDNQSEMIKHRFYSHNDPLPDCFNKLVVKFLETASKYAWFVEEDVVVPKDALQRLLKASADIVAINYLLRAAPVPSQCLYQGKLLWVSLGCTLVKRKVFEVLPFPWFRTDLAVTSTHTGSAGNWCLGLMPVKSQYGGHDAFFCYYAIQAGFRMAVVEDRMCDHLSYDYEQVA